MNLNVIKDMVSTGYWIGNEHVCDVVFTFNGKQQRLRTDLYTAISEYETGGFVYLKDGMRYCHQRLYMTQVYRNQIAKHNQTIASLKPAILAAQNDRTHDKLLQAEITALSIKNSDAEHLIRKLGEENQVLNDLHRTKEEFLRKITDESEALKESLSQYQLKITKFNAENNQRRQEIQQMQFKLEKLLNTMNVMQKDHKEAIAKQKNEHTQLLFSKIESLKAAAIGIYSAMSDSESGSESGF